MRDTGHQVSDLEDRSLHASPPGRDEDTLRQQIDDNKVGGIILYISF